MVNIGEEVEEVEVAAQAHAVRECWGGAADRHDCDEQVTCSFSERKEVHAKSRSADICR